MYEKAKNILSFIGVIAILFLLLGGWTMLRNYLSTDGGTADDVRNALDNARQEQQNALDGIGRIESGIERSEILIGGLEERNRKSQETIARIEQSHQRLKEAIERYEERVDRCEELVRDSESRVGECQQILQAVRKANEPKG